MSLKKPVNSFEPGRFSQQAIRNMKKAHLAMLRYHSLVHSAAATSTNNKHIKNVTHEIARFRDKSADNTPSHMESVSTLSNRRHTEIPIRRIL